MSTLPNSAVLFPDWKQEINRRIAAHKSGRSPLHDAAAAPMEPPASRAARAAARVAERYAKAPTYGEMLARDARAAVDAAKAAAIAAEEAHAAFQYVLDGLEVAAPAEPGRNLEPVADRNLQRAEMPAAAAPQDAPELPHTRQAPAIYEPAAEHPWHGNHAEEESADLAFWQPDAAAEQQPSVAYDVVRRSELPAIAEADGRPEEIVKPIYANLIEFPRPMVAARRARPRRAEGPLATDVAPQLSIFEVDPGAISIAPPQATPDPSASPSWMRTEWPALATEVALPSTQAEQPPSRNSEALPPAVCSEEPLSSIGEAARSGLHGWLREESSAGSSLDEEAESQSALRGIESAPLNRRMLAVVVDCALSAAMLVLAGLAAAPHVSRLPDARAAAFGAMLAFVAAGLAYHACFFTVARATPGMWYAGIEIDTFSGYAPTRKQRWRRLMSMLLSVLPLGLGFLWALFDDRSLAWHDRLSGTYLRRQ